MRGPRSPAPGPSARTTSSRRSMTRRPSARSSHRTIRRQRKGTIMNIEGKRVLITGGSSGIGLGTAQALVAKGAKVAITGRRPDVLAAAVGRLRADGGSVESIAADVATPDGRATTLTRAIEILGGLHLLINNAGGVRAGRLESTSQADILAMIEIDLVAPILLTRAALPALRASGDAMVVNVASGIALIGAPFYAPYAGVKAGLARFGAALRRGLDGEGIHLLTPYPGGTHPPRMALIHPSPH